MKKVLLATLLFVGIAATTFAQDGGGSKLSIGVDAGIPIGSTADGYNLAIGGSLKYELPIASGTNFTISAGYTSFQGKTITSGIKFPALSFVPVKVGVKHFFAESFYGEAQVGAAIRTTSIAGSTGSKVAFAYAPGIGYNITENLDLGVRFEGWAVSGGTTNQVAARFAYSF